MFSSSFFACHCAFAWTEIDHVRLVLGGKANFSKCINIVWYFYIMLNPWYELQSVSQSHSSRYSYYFLIRLLRRLWHLLSQPFLWMSIRSWTGKFYTWLSFDAIIIIIFFFFLIQLPHQDTKSYTLKFLFSHSSKN